MISIIPALDFLRALCGRYEDSSGETTMRIWSCGYGVALDLVSKDKSVLCGVVGAFSQDVECFAHIGLPNVIRTLGRKISDSEVRLVGDDFPIEFHFSQEIGILKVEILFNGQTKGVYELLPC